MMRLFRILTGPVLLTALLGLGIVPVAAQGPTGTSCTDIATFVTDVTIPDNTVVAPSTTFTKTWQVRNDGTCTWGSGYSLVFAAGQAMTSNTSVPVPQTAPRATANLSVPMTAPTSHGTVQSFWQMRNASGQAFGPIVWVVVQVGSGGAQTNATPSRVPAQAPPLSAASSNLDNPANAFSVGQAIPALPAGSAEWLQFTYDGSTSFPRSPVTIRLLNGVANNLSFEIYSPDRMVNGGWFNQPPVGRGTPEILNNCYQGGVNVGTCRTNDLLWTGPLGPNGTYYVRVINPTGSTIAPQLIISGPGLSQCPSAAQAAGPTTAQNQPFVQVQCSPSAPGTLAP